MTGAEIMSTSLWEFQDMLSALSVYNGTAKVKKKKKPKTYTYDEVVAMMG